MKQLIDYAIGETYEGYLLIKRATKGITQKGAPFMTVILQDQSADIEAKLWETTEEHEKQYEAGTIVKVGGELHDYRGRTQLRVKKIRPARPDEPVELADLVPAASTPKEELYERLLSYVDEMENESIERITRTIVEQNREKLLVYPAAMSNHHDYVSGLIDHVVSMLSLSRAFVDHYPLLNRDLLYAGIILHDIGKVQELTGPIGTTYTVEGNLLGHITIMVSTIDEVAKSLGIEGEEVVLLQHMVLSHHGKEEWGSPKRPMLPEAEMLHYIDNIDAKMHMFERAMKVTEPGEFTNRIFPLDNRMFYKARL